jgi:glucose-1-phosphate cytidylyltransferase
MLEREPLEQAANQGQLMAYKHDGFWHCMDSKRDHDLLESLWLKGAPWAK